MRATELFATTGRHVVSQGLGDVVTGDRPDEPGQAGRNVCAQRFGWIQEVEDARSGIDAVEDTKDRRDGRTRAYASLPRMADQIHRLLDEPRRERITIVAFDVLLD